MDVKRPHISNIKNFCITILTVNHKQRKSILELITVEQCGFLKEISLNILLNSELELTEKERKYLRHRLGYVKQLASHSICFEEKKDIAAGYNSLIKKLCIIVLRYLQKQENN